MNFYISFSLLIKNSYLASDKQKRVPTNATANLPLCAKNKAGLRRIRFTGHMRLSARRVEWSSAGLCRYCLDREGGRPVDQFDQYSNLSENTSHSTWGRHTHKHTYRCGLQTYLNRFASVNCRFMFTGYLKVQRLQHTPNTHTHAHTWGSFNSISCQVFSSSVAFLLLFLLAFVFV